MKKFLKIAGVLILLLLIVLIAVPYLFKDRIVQTVKENVNASLNAKVDFGDFDLTLLENFPDFTFEIDDVTIDGLGQFDSTRLASIGTTSFTLDVKSVLSGDKLKIKGISVDQAYLNAIVLEDGTANYDIIKEDAGEEEVESEASDVRDEYHILLEEYELSNSEIIYDNRSLGAFLHIEGLDHSGNGKLTDKRYDLNTRTTTKSVDVAYEGVRYLQKAVADVKAVFDVQDDFREINLKENEIQLNELLLMAEGQVLLPEDGVDMDIAYRSTQTDLKSILSLIPSAFMPDLEGLSTSGNMKLSGEVAGHYDDFSFPGFTLRTEINDGLIQYPDLPEDVESIFLDLLVDFPGGGTDFNTTVVDLKRLRANIAESPIDASLLMKDMMTDPYMKSEIRTQLNFSRVKEAIAMEGVDDLQGILTADVNLEGRMSAIEEERYHDFNASGQMIMQNFVFHSDSMPATLNINTAHLNVDPQGMELANFSGKFGDSDIKASGVIDNYLSYFLKDETLHGSFNVQMQKLDMNQFLSESEVPATGNAVASESASVSLTEGEATGVIEVPSNVNLDLNAEIGALLYEDLSIANVKGKIQVANSVAQLKGVSMDVLGGRVTMDGAYATERGKAPNFDFGFRVAGMDIPSTASTFNTVNTLAPVAKQCKGDFSSAFTMTTSLDENMNPMLNSLTGGGDMNTDNVSLENFPALMKIAQALKQDKWQKVDLKDVDIQFAFEDGKVRVQPFEVKLDGIETVVGGTMSFEQELDYDVAMKVPVEMLGNQAGSLLNNLTGQANNLGLDLSMGQFVNMKFDVTGTFNEPKLRPTIIGQEGGSIKDEIQDAIIEEVEEIKEELISDGKEEARKQADKILADAQQQADALRAEAKRGAKRLRDEADNGAQKLLDEAGGNPLKKAAAKIAGDKLKKEADKKAVKLEEEADAQAKSLMDKAQKRADDLLK